MVRAGKWFRSFLAGRKEKSQENKEAEPISWLPLPPSQLPPAIPGESIQKKRNFDKEWKKLVPKDRFSQSGRRSIAGGAGGRKTRFIPIEDIAAIKIQSSFRSYLARKALRALKGVVKLQALARGSLARKRAAESLRSLQDLSAAQTRALAHRAPAMEADHGLPWRESFMRKMTVEFKSQQLHDVQKNTETEQGQLKGSSRNRKSSNLTSYNETKEHRVSSYMKAPSSPLDFIDASWGAIEEPYFAAAKGGTQFLSSASHKPCRIRYSEDFVMHDGNEFALFPNYMENTESWRAKGRSQTAPRQRPESAEQKQSGRREGRSLSRVVSGKEQHLWCSDLDRSATTRAGYCKFIVA